MAIQANLTVRSLGAAARPKGSGDGEGDPKLSRRQSFAESALSLSVRRREGVQIPPPDLASLILKTNSKSTLLCQQAEVVCRRKRQSFKERGWETDLGGRADSRGCSVGSDGDSLSPSGELGTDLLITV